MAEGGIPFDQLQKSRIDPQQKLRIAQNKKAAKQRASQHTSHHTSILKDAKGKGIAIGTGALIAAGGGTAIVATHHEPPRAIVAHAEEQPQPEIIQVPKTMFTDILTKDAAQYKDARKRISEQMDYVLKIVVDPKTEGKSKHLQELETVAPIIKEEAEKQGVPFEFAAAIATIEGTDLSSEGALGWFQLLENTGKSLGLTIERGKDGNIITDERLDPKKSIAAGIKYLRQQMDLNNGDLGLAALGYYSGFGTETRLAHIMNPDLPTQDAMVEDFAKAKLISQYFRENNITEHTLLTNQKVAAVIKADREKVKKGEKADLPPSLLEYVPRVAAAMEYLTGMHIIEGEKITITVPKLSDTPKPRTDGAKV